MPAGFVMPREIDSGSADLDVVLVVDLNLAVVDQFPAWYPKVTH